MDLFVINFLDGLIYGLLLFMLSSGLTLIFSMMGVLNLAHSAFFMLGAYFAYQISLYLGFWVGLLVAPPIVTVLGALVERYGLRQVHQYGHVPELIFTFGLYFVIEELVQYIWGKNFVEYRAPESLDFVAFTLAGGSIQAYKVFMLLCSVAIFLGLYYVLARTRVGMIIQASLSYPKTVESLGHNVPLVFMGVFGVGTGLAGVAGVIAGPTLQTYPGMAFALGSIVFVCVVVGGLGSLFGAFVASLIIGWMKTFAAAYNVGAAEILMYFGFEYPDNVYYHPWRDLWTLTLPQIGPLLPYLLLVLILIFRPYGLFGRRDA
jgi:branched-chain amino acid transport system permease protein